MLATAGAGLFATLELSMNAEKIREPAGQAAARKYGGYGLFGGVALGLLVGILISGPHFDEWSASASLAIVLACAAGGALMGWLCLGIASGGVAHGVPWGGGHAAGGEVPGAGENSGGGDGGDAF